MSMIPGRNNLVGRIAHLFHTPPPRVPASVLHADIIGLELTPKISSLKQTLVEQQLKLAEVEGLPVNRDLATQIIRLTHEFKNPPTSKIVKEVPRNNGEVLFTEEEPVLIRFGKKIISVISSNQQNEIEKQKVKAAIAKELSLAKQTLETNLAPAKIPHDATLQELSTLTTKVKETQNSLTQDIKDKKTGAKRSIFASGFFGTLAAASAIMSPMASKLGLPETSLPLSTAATTVAAVLKKRKASVQTQEQRLLELASNELSRKFHGIEY